MKFENLNFSYVQTPELFSWNMCYKAEEERGLLYLGVGLVPKCEAQILESIFYDFLESVLLDWIKEVPYRHIQCESIE